MPWISDSAISRDVGRVQELRNEPPYRMPWNCSPKLSYATARPSQARSRPLRRPASRFCRTVFLALAFCTCNSPRPGELGPEDFRVCKLKTFIGPDILKFKCKIFWHVKFYLLAEGLLGRQRRLNLSSSRALSNVGGGGRGEERRGAVGGSPCTLCKL
jgi:hypothetical protein